MKNRNKLIAIVALLGAVVTLSATGFGNSQRCCLGKKHASKNQGTAVQAI